MRTDLKIGVVGTAFSAAGHDLRALETVVTGVRGILDRLLAVGLGQQQLSERLKRQIDYRIDFAQPPLTLVVAFELQQTPTLEELGGDESQLAAQLLALLEGALELRGAVAKQLDGGEEMHLSIADDLQSQGRQAVSVHPDTGEVQIHNARILWAAQAIKASVDRLIQQVDGERIAYVEFRHGRQRCRLEPRHQILLGRKKEELNTDLEIVGRLDMISFSTSRGMIVSGGERLAVTWDEGIRQQLQRVADVDGVIFNARPVVDHKRLHKEAVGFVILDCRHPQESLGL